MTDVLVLETVKEGEAALVAMALMVGGYKPDGRAPKEGDKLAFFPEEKLMRATAPDTEVTYPDGTPAKIKRVDAKELISTLRGMAELDLADAMEKGKSIDEALADMIGIDKGAPSEHDTKMMLENSDIKIIFCVNCARKFALNQLEPEKDAKFLADYMNPKVIRLLIGTILNNEDML